MTRKKLVGIVVIALFLLATAGAASAATLDLPKWVIVPEDSTFSDVDLFIGMDAYADNGDGTYNVTKYYQGNVGVATLVDANTSDADTPSLVTGVIGNAIQLNGDMYIDTGVNIQAQSWSVVVAVKFLKSPNEVESNINICGQGYNDIRLMWHLSSNAIAFVQSIDGEYTEIRTTFTPRVGRWYLFEFVWTNGLQRFVAYDYETREKLYDRTWSYTYSAMDHSTNTLLIGKFGTTATEYPYFIVDEFRFYENSVPSDDQVKLILYAGRKKLSEPANFRQIFSPMIDLTRDKATFYAGLEISTSDPNGYVPVPESAVNMSITSAEKLKSDYTNADFYYQGHYWYRADKIQFNLPIQFETVREKGSFDKVIVLDEDQKTYVYEKEFKVTNPTATKINVIYSVDPVDLGFSVLQYPEFELDGIRMVSWQPQNSTDLYLIRTDTLEPGEISTHWIKSIWTLSKEELEFPAKLEDFRNILDWQTAQRLAENAVKGKSDTYVKVIKISSNADVSNVTIYVPLNDVEDPGDVIEAMALTGSRATLQVEKLDDGTIAVKVPADAFVSGEAEIKVFYNKETSWWKSILDKIMSMVKMIKSFFGFGGG